MSCNKNLLTESLLTKFGGIFWIGNLGEVEIVKEAAGIQRGVVGTILSILKLSEQPNLALVLVFVHSLSGCILHQCNKCPKRVTGFYEKEYACVRLLQDIRAEF
jgi:hypothetical protein